ncbi:MAG: sialate O-acetylesterase [Oscillospiraceae bacterium]|nr:sialate O-acetylesterase [Oscillospiraceae bacterium]
MARFQVSPLFGNEMVLQRGKNICVFGTGEDGVIVRAELCGFTTTCVVTNGKWRVIFPPMGACRYMSMTVTDAETGEFVHFTNVAIGEVWLAGGQSNMELELCNCKGGEEAIANDNTKDVRYYYFPKKTLLDPDHDEQMNNASWTTFTNKEAARHWSAVAYFCAKEMSEYLGVTVGIIGCNWGGTSASCWIDRDYARGGAAVYFDEYDAYMAARTVDEAVADYRAYQKYQDEWEQKRVEFVKNSPNATYEEIVEAIGESKYPGPPAPCSPNSPGVLYDGMVKFVAPYTLGGVLWYQGETDEVHPHAYYTLLTQLIRNWREAWNDDYLPFVIGQLPMFAGGNPDGEAWCLIREAQMRVYNTIKNTGIAVLTDCGERDNIHPVDKKPVGHRFAMQALDIVYGGCDGAFAPSFKNAIWRGDTVELQFNDARGGFKVKGDPDGFEICGEDGVYHPAYADISGERIFVSADEIPNPCGVRYLWRNYAEVKIFGAFGLPLAPFRITKL